MCRYDFRLLRRFDPGRASLATYLSLVARSATLDALRGRRAEVVPLELQHALSEARLGTCIRLS